MEDNNHRYYIVYRSDVRRLKLVMINIYVRPIVGDRANIGYCYLLIMLINCKLLFELAGTIGLGHAALANCLVWHFGSRFHFISLSSPRLFSIVHHIDTGIFVTTDWVWTIFALLSVSNCFRLLFDLIRRRSLQHNQHSLIGAVSWT